MDLNSAGNYWSGWLDKHFGEFLAAVVSALGMWWLALRKMVHLEPRLRMLEKSISSHLTEAEPMMDEFRAVKADQGSMKRTLDFLVQEQRSLRQDQLDHYRWTAEQAQDAGKARELGERIEALKQETRKEPRT